MQFVSNGLQHTLSQVMVFQSTDYAHFKMISGNRQLNESKIKRIIRDIEAGIDVLAYYPITVVEKQKRLEIIDGQHRFYIAKKLKRSVHYIVMQKTIDLHDVAKINSNVEKWKTSDFINCYIQQGNEHYKKLQEFLDTYDFSPTVSIKLLQNGHPGTESGLGTNNDFQRGYFAVKYWDEAVKIADSCKLFSQFKYWKDRGFIIAIFRIMDAGKITLDELLQKYQKYPDMLTKQSGFKDYLFCLENIFNRGKQIRIVIY